MVKVEIDIIIDRPPAEVFAFIANFENNPRWQSGMQAAEYTSDGPFGVGTTYKQVAQFLGRRIESHFEVIAYEPDRMVQATTTESSFPITFMRSVEAHNGGSRVKAVITGDASGFFKLAEPLLGFMTRRSIRTDYARLKKSSKPSPPEYIQVTRSRGMGRS